LGEVLIDGQRFADLLVFGSTVDNDGNRWDHGSVSITIAGRHLAATDLRQRDAVSPDSGDRDITRSPSSSAADYVIVTSAALAPALQQLAAYKNESGYATIITTVENIVASYAGRDDAERVRNYLIEFYADGGRYVLLAGDETVVPIRYAYHYNTSSTPDPDALQVCDLYFADITGDWDKDNDGVWGERYDDAADLTPELWLGRLPVNNAVEVANYTNKLIAYETDPGDGNRDYLERAYFFSSDQMRDYSNGGQHGRIARAYPEIFAIDTASGVELSQGDDVAPTNLPADVLDDTLSAGFGIVNIIAHGGSNAFVVRSSGYNEFPKSFFGETQCDGLAANNRTAFYYSLACSNGAFDLDQPPYNETAPNLAQLLIGCEHAGAVGFVAYSRWGWINSSYLLQTTFFDSLFAHPDRPAVQAMYDSKATYYYYRDLVYGQNYLGDPTLRVHTGRPDDLDVATVYTKGEFELTVRSNGTPIADCAITVAEDGQMLATYRTDGDGRVIMEDAFSSGTTYTITASRAGYCLEQVAFSPSVVTDIDDDNLLPGSYRLAQNYPNPFNPSTVIDFEIPRQSAVTLIVYNVLGQQVATLAEQDLSAGVHSVTWDGRDDTGGAAASGVYFYRLQAGDFSAARKMILLQ
ncbi:MAG: T9SS type A sorting domain-containing protein, partial [candidate division Zixibacteria bacterium]|nr:T9SS type A sorting domain-containing protein [candidate division Zixibacteria bacterium]